MASITLRPIGGSGIEWSNTDNAYDENESTCASVSVSSRNYSSRTLTLDFDTTVIPLEATINSATLTLRSKADENTISAYVDINGSKKQRVINQEQSTTITNYTADVAKYIFRLSSILITAYNSNWLKNTFELYELWIDVDYTTSTTSTTYTIIASSNVGGSISPNGETVVLENSSQSYTISADTGYKIKDVLIDGVSQGAITSYTFTNVNSNHTIEVVFESVPTVIAAIENNVFYAINVFEGYSEFSIGPDGVYLNAIAKDLNENESIYLDSNYTLHVFNFIKEDL